MKARRQGKRIAAIALGIVVLVLVAGGLALRWAGGEIKQRIAGCPRPERQRRSNRRGLPDDPPWRGPARCAARLAHARFAARRDDRYRAGLGRVAVPPSSSEVGRHRPFPSVRLARGGRPAADTSRSQGARRRGGGPAGRRIRTFRRAQAQDGVPDRPDRIPRRAVRLLRREDRDAPVCGSHAPLQTRRSTISIFRTWRIARPSGSARRWAAASSRSRAG